MTDDRSWRLQGFDTFAGEWYPLAGSYASRAEAEQAALQRLDELERSQPSAHSGGQGAGGIQDRVYVVAPGGDMYRFTV